MYIHELLNTLKEIKKSYPHYDLNNFKLKINEEDIVAVSLDLETFAVIVHNHEPQDIEGTTEET